MPHLGGCTGRPSIFKSQSNKGHPRPKTEAPRGKKEVRPRSPTRQWSSRDTKAGLGPPNPLLLPPKRPGIRWSFHRSAPVASTARPERPCSRNREGTQPQAQAGEEGSGQDAAGKEGSPSSHSRQEACNSQGRGGAELAALTCPGPRGGWCGPGTRTQRPPADRGSTPGPARPARGPGASSSVDTWRRRSPWPRSVGRPGPDASKISRQGRWGVRRAAAGEGLAGERRSVTGRARAPVRKGGREGARRAGRVTQQP